MAGCCSEKGREINFFFQPAVEFRSGGEKTEGMQCMKENEVILRTEKGIGVLKHRKV